MGRITNELQNLKETDIWSFILFALFKIRELPEFSAISELAYILDKNNLLKLCSIFGGMTITIPTITELENIIYTLLLYQYVDIEHYSYEEACLLLDQDNVDMRCIRQLYTKIRDLLNTYEFSNRGK